MRLRKIGHLQPPAVIHVAPRRLRRDRGRPLANRTVAEREPTMCERCSAVYQAKTWRAGARTRSTSLVGVGWTLCPACAQLRDAEYFGRVRVTAPLAPEFEREVRRRIWRVEARARLTQPERRTVRIDPGPPGLEVLATSQKLAHRIARELQKAFGGRARYTWTDREGGLDATWEPPARPGAKPRGRRAIRSRHGPRRSPVAR